MYIEENEIEERVDKLEEYMMQLAYQQSETGMMIRDLSNEMKDFKNEMKDFKNEMKNEMKEFKDEMKEFKDEMKNDRKDMNKKWGEIANKMGTLVEDIIAPAVSSVIKKYFKCDIDYFAVNVRKNRSDINLKGEFDIIATSNDKVFLVETKSRPKKQYVFDFLENIKNFKKLFPEYSQKTLIPILASLRFELDIIKLATENNIYAMAYKEWEYMDILNFDSF